MPVSFCLMKPTKTTDCHSRFTHWRAVSKRGASEWPRICVRISVVALILTLLPGTPLPGQDKPDITVQVKVVNVFATVRDKHGDIVRNLTKDDFVLDQDGHLQTIKYFLQEADLPLTLGLLVDTSLSQRRVLGEERTASYSFLDHMLREDKDKAFVIHFDREVELLQDLTSSRKKLESSLGLLDSPDEDNGNSGNGPGGQRGGSRGFRGAGTLLYDAIFLGSNELMKKQQGRKAMIILSDGVDHGSRETLRDAIESAQRSDTLVYSILFSGDEGNGNRRGGGYGHPHIGLGGPIGGGWPGGSGGGSGGGGGGGYPQREEEHVDGKKILEQISQETGAHLFEVSKKLTIDQIYAQIEEELRNQYSLGYTPEGADAELGYHKIHLAAKPKDLTVQARDGYYADR